jgi:hypothetical protein
MPKIAGRAEFLLQRQRHHHSGDDYRNPRSFQATEIEHELLPSPVCRLSTEPSLYPEWNIDYNVPRRHPARRSQLEPFFGLRSGLKPNPNIGQVTVKIRGTVELHRQHLPRLSIATSDSTSPPIYLATFVRRRQPGTSGGYVSNPFDFVRSTTGLYSCHLVGGYTMFSPDGDRAGQLVQISQRHPV